MFLMLQISWQHTQVNFFHHMFTIFFWQPKGLAFPLQELFIIYQLLLVMVYWMVIQGYWFLWTSMLSCWRIFKCSLWILLWIVIIHHEKWFNGSASVNWQLQLQSLMETLSATEPHYIRCVKPNNDLKPAIFENSNILQQLRCGVSMILSTCTIFFITFFTLFLFGTYVIFNFVWCEFFISTRVFLRQLG